MNTGARAGRCRRGRRRGSIGQPSESGNLVPAGFEQGGDDVGANLALVADYGDVGDTVSRGGVVGHCQWSHVKIVYTKVGLLLLVSFTLRTFLLRSILFRGFILMVPPTLHFQKRDSAFLPVPSSISSIHHVSIAAPPIQYSH